MSKAGAVLAIMSLIVGVSGVGIGVVSWYATSQLQEDYNDFKIDFNEPKIWYKEYNFNAFHWTSDGDYSTIEKLTINFTVKENETMYFCYTGEAIIYHMLRDASYLSIYFNIDGYHLVNPTVRVGVSQTYSSSSSQSITLQFSTPVLSVGAHNVTIDLVTTTYSDNHIKQNTLIVMAIQD